MNASNPVASNVHPTTSTAPRWPATLSGAALLIVSACAFSTAAQASSGDCAALLFLGVLSALAFWTKLSRHFFNDTSGARQAATFALLAAMFLIYSLARRVEIGENVALRFALTGEDVFPVSYASVAVILAAPIAMLGNWRHRTRSGVVTALGATLGILALLGLFSFRFLSGFYVVGAAEELDPTPLIHLLMQCVEYGALTILCSVAMGDLTVRRWVLRALPVLLLALWARHQFAAPLPEEEE